jgi:hypothetical protein
MLPEPRIYKPTKEELEFITQTQSLMDQAKNEYQRLQNELNGGMRMMLSSKGLKGDFNYDNDILTEKLDIPLTDYAKEAFTLGLAGNHSEAVEVCNRALTQYPNDNSIYHEMAFHELLQGNWEQGWKCWEFRNSRLGNHGLVTIMKNTLPNLLEWKGEPLTGKKILIPFEGAIGDGIQYLRYFRFLKDAGATIIGLCRSVQFARFIEEMLNLKVVGGDESVQIPDLSYWCGLYSLPLLTKQYVPPEPVDLGIHWKKQSRDKLRVGVAIHGATDPIPAAANFRPPADFDLWKPLSQIEGIECVSLQLGETPDWCVSGLGDNDSLISTAKIISDLDLVCTPDCMIVHLAGSIGVPTFVPFSESVYWPFENGNKTILYPSVTLFRKTGSWEDCFSNVIKTVVI